MVRALTSFNLLITYSFFHWCTKVHSCLSKIPFRLAQSGLSPLFLCIICIAVENLFILFYTLYLFIYFLHSYNRLWIESRIFCIGNICYNRMIKREQWRSRWAENKGSCANASWYITPTSTLKEVSTHIHLLFVFSSSLCKWPTHIFNGFYLGFFL